MPVHDRSAMTFHLSRGQLVGRLDLTTPLEADRPVGCPSGHIAAPLTSATVIREAAHAGTVGHLSGTLSIGRLLSRAEHSAVIASALKRSSTLPYSNA